MLTKFSCRLSAFFVFLATKELYFYDLLDSFILPSYSSQSKKRYAPRLLLMCWRLEVVLPGRQMKIVSERGLPWDWEVGGNYFVNLTGVGG